MGVIKSVERCMGLFKQKVVGEVLSQSVSRRNVQQDRQDSWNRVENIVKANYAWQR